MEVFGLLLLFGIVGMLGFILLTLIYGEKMFTDKVKRGITFCLFFGACVAFSAQHFYMSNMLSDVKIEFKHVAETSSQYTQAEIQGGESYYKLDYGGTIDDILLERDKILKSKHFIMLGRWRIRAHSVNEISANTAAVIYIWWPF